MKANTNNQIFFIIKKSRENSNVRVALNRIRHTNIKEEEEKEERKRKKEGEGERSGVRLILYKPVSVGAPSEDQTQ